VLLEFLNTRVEAGDTREHLVVLVLEPLHFFASFDDLALQLVYRLESLFELQLGLVQVLLHVASCSDGLDCQPLLPLQLVLQVVSLADELVVLLHSEAHLLDSVVLLLLALLPEDGLGSEHGREELCILPDLIELVVDFLLELPRLLHFRNIEVLVLADLVLGIPEL